MRSIVLLLGLVCFGCSGSTASTDGTNGNPNSPTNGQGTGDGGSSSTGGSTGGAGGGADGGGTVIPPGPPVATGTTFGTYIVLGDSISDKGGEAPFFYDLLLKNDDAAYPSFAGHDLTTKYPGIQYVHAAVAGSVTDLYPDETGANAPPTLAAQIKALGTTYPGDVLITLTIGGNDLNFHSFDAVQGTDANDKQLLATHLHDELAELTTPGRLGTGKVTIIEANIYDASDGQGNWNIGKCGPNLDVGASFDVAAFTGWNSVISNAIGQASGDHSLDLHQLFMGHGYNSTDNWFFPDCLHPNKKGHGMLRAAFWQELTGESL